jgi:hypothetical protein
VVTVGDYDGVVSQVHVASGHYLDEVDGHAGRRLSSLKPLRHSRSYVAFRIIHLVPCLTATHRMLVSVPFSPCTPGRCGERWFEPLALNSPQEFALGP